MRKENMKNWEVPIHGTLGEECISVIASNINVACTIAWGKLNTDLDNEYMEYWGDKLDWKYTIYKYPEEILNIWNMDLFYSPALEERYGGFKPS